jgi:hypothetical protein
MLSANELAKRVLGVAAVLGVAGGAGVALAQPANDACAAAQVIAVADPYVTVFGDNLNATAESAVFGCRPFTTGAPAAPEPIGNLDVWYTFVAPRAGVYGVTTIGTAPPLSAGTDTTLAIYASCDTLATTEPLACNDDIFFSLIGAFNWVDARTSVTLSAGQQVYVRVAGIGDVQGFFQLTIAPPALNDNCAQATVVTQDTPVIGTNIAALTGVTLSSAASLCENGLGGSRGFKDVWYSFTPTASGPYRVSLCPSVPGTGFDANIAVMTSCPGGSTVGAPTVIACNEDVGPGGTCFDPNDPQGFVWLPEIQSVALTAGVTYQIRVAGYNYCVSGNSCAPNTNEGLFTLLVSSAAPLPPAPANDTCATAQQINSLPFIGGAVLIGGAGDDTDVTCNAVAASQTRSGVWYRYTPATDCTLSLQQTDPSTASVVAVFTGSCGSLTQVLCAGNGVVNENPTLSVLAGQTYWILVGEYEASRAGALDQINLSVDCTAPLANDLCAGATELSVGVPVSASNTTATTAGDGMGGTCAGASVSIGKGVWYSFTPAQDGLYTFDACDSTTATRLTLFTGGSCADPATWTQVACASGGCGAGNVNARIVDAALTAGVTYRLRLASVRPELATTPFGGTYTLSVAFTPGSSVVCCRGTTCAVVANSAECVVPPGATVGASVAGGASVCNAGSSTQTPCCYADFDKVGSNTIDDIFIYLNAWFANSPYAKVGGDGVAVPTIDDIFVFLNAWFAGC